MDTFFTWLSDNNMAISIVIAMLACISAVKSAFFSKQKDAARSKQEDVNLIGSVSIGNSSKIKNITINNKDVGIKND